jgi:PAS domain-containing protein
LSPPVPAFIDQISPRDTRIDVTTPVASLLDVIDADGILVWANQSETAALGYAEGSLVGHPASAIYTDETVGWVLRVLQGLLGNSPPPAELALKRQDGSILKVLARATLGHCGGVRVTLDKSPLGALGARVSRLEAENRLLRQIADTGKEAHWCIEFADAIDISLAEDEIVFRVFSHASYWRLCNLAMSRLYGLPHQLDLCEQSVRLYWPRSPANEAFVRRIIRSGYAIDGALSVDQRYDGSELRVENDVRADIEGGFLRRLWGSCRPLDRISGAGT